MHNEERNFAALGAMRDSKIPFAPVSSVVDRALEFEPMAEENCHNGQWFTDFYLQKMRIYAKNVNSDRFRIEKIVYLCTYKKCVSTQKM